MIKLTRSKDETPVYVVKDHIVSFARIERFNATAINMAHGPTIWVDEKPEVIHYMLL